MAVVLALVAAAAWGVGDFLGGHAARATSAIRLTFVAEVVALAGALVLVAQSGATVPDARGVLGGSIAGIAGAGGQALLYWCLANGSVAVLAPIAAATGAVVPVLVGLLQGERPGLLGAVGVAVGCAAVVLVSREISRERSAHRPVALAAAVGAGLCFGVHFVTLDAAPAATGMWPVVVSKLVGVPFLGLLAITTIGRRAGSDDRPARPGVPAWIGVAVAIGVLDLIANSSYLAATNLGLLSVVAMITSLYPAVTVVLAMSLGRERPGRAQQIGLALAGVSLVLVSSGGH